MDSKSRLDYALFQLTPTRTRCDLVICAGDCKEKLASGLLEPFIAHLKFAKDQISRGGYSITLSASDSASWFTKSTLERFVRFVSTPEVLERSITIEREIANIELSLNINTPSDSQSAYKYEGDTNDSAPEEDSKVHLQRVLETRKSALQKEQAMVYARALVAGFETDNLEDLICFADAFGSPRLREACLNFMELLNTKSDDRVWMDEVAAMQAYSRSQNSYISTSSAIIFPEEDNQHQELRINVHNGNFATKKHNIVEDIQIYHGNPMFYPPYQGYPFPPMVIPPYYQQNPPWKDFENGGKLSQKKESQDGNFDSSDDNTTYEDKHDGQKMTQQWNIFQNLLLKDVEDKEPEFDSKSSTTHKEQDWILGSLQDKKVDEKSKDIFEDHFQATEITKDVLVDDSLAVQARSFNKSSESHLRSQDIVMVSDNLSQKAPYSPNKNVNEPNDLHMVLERDTYSKQTMPTWTPEMELGNNDVKEVNKKSSKEKKSRPVKGLERKGSIIEAKSKALLSKKPIAKGKSDKEEEKRKKMEELLTQRKKRIIERSAANTNKSNGQLSSQDMKKSNKTVIRSSTINRLSTARVINPKVLPSESKPKKVTTKKVSESKATKMATKKINESKPTKIVTKKIGEPSFMKVTTKKTVESKPTKVAIKKIGESKPTKTVTNKIGEPKSMKVTTKKIVESKPTKVATKKIGETKPTKVATKNIDSKNSNGPKKIDIMNNVKQLPISPPNHQSAKIENIKHENKSSSSVLQEDKTLLIGNSGLAKKSLNTVTFKINEDYGVKENPSFEMNREISTIKSPERNNSRKKWSGFETSTKALSGFRKLLSFGRRR